MQRIIALEQSMAGIRKESQKIECDADDCAICKEVRNDDSDEEENKSKI